MSKRRRAFTGKGLEIRAADLVGAHGIVPLHERRPSEEVFYLLTLTISMAGETGTSLFYTRIATPEALKAMAPERPVVMFSRAVMIVSEFDWQVIQAELKAILKVCEAPTWSEATERLLRYFSWEYENMPGAAQGTVVARS
jgi:Immunity protein 8